MASEASTVSGNQSVEALRRELAEAREQQAATAGILAAMSSSPTDPYRAFADIAASAARLCDAQNSTVVQLADGKLRLLANYGPLPTVARVGQLLPGLPFSRGSVTARAIIDKTTIHVADVQIETNEYPEGSEWARRAGHRAIVAVPLMRAGEAIGAIVIRRAQVRPFTDRQIELLRTFADQAVIAIENTRLFEEVQARTTELQESLEYQTAIGDVLGVISRSPSDVQPVLETIAKTARRLCAADRAIIWRLEKDQFLPVARDGVTLTSFDKLIGETLPADHTTVAGRAVIEKRAIHIEDYQADPQLTYLKGAFGDPRRTMLSVPLFRDDAAIGAIVLTRTVVRPFAQQQIDLVTTFADQAAIAIENTRLFEAEQTRTRELTERTQELTETLEYQTATSDVLNVISRSKFDLQPVLDTIAIIASRLCAAEDAAILLRESEDLRVAAHHSTIMASQLNVRIPIGRGFVGGRAVVDQQPIQVPDLTVAGDEFPQGREIADRLGLRTSLGIPLLREDIAIGCILLRRKVVRPFDEKQITLLQTFADQAVIAIENTRLFEAEQASKRELTEALEQQTATADVLKVISRSALDVQKVLDALVESAARLCNAYDAAIFQVFGDGLRSVAHHGQIPTTAPVGQLTIPLERGSMGARAAIDRRPIHVADILAEGDEYPESRKRALQIGHRTLLAVPLVHAGEAIGVIYIRRTEVRPFTQRQIELVNTFADQAVIAIENARLFEEVQARTKELQESLDRQTATSEVLGVISRSPNEVQPVLDTIVATAQRLCQAERASVWRLEGGTFRAVAHRGQPEERVESLLSARMPVSRGSMVGRATLARRAVQVEDVATDPELVAATHVFNRAGNVHTVLAVPLLLKGHPIGVISLTRTRVAPFDDKQVALVESFADQAVIAIENTRLFEAEQASKRELQESLEYQTATSQVLGVIARSPGELQPVLDKIVETASRLCGAEVGFVHLQDERSYAFQPAASYGYSPEIVEAFRKLELRPSRGHCTGRALLEGRTVQILDVLADPEYLLVEVQLTSGHHTTMAVPLKRDGKAIGVISLSRRTVRAFSEKQITLVETFADQAVIAIENARLFEAEQASKCELARSVEELESLGKVSQAVNSSLELDKVLPTILEHACAMSYAGGGTVYVFDKTTSEFRLAAAHNMSDEHIAMVRAQPMRLNSVVVGECATRREVVQVADLSSAAPSPLLDILLRTGVRAVLAVPLLHQAEVVGVLVVRRNQAGTFSSEIVRLVEFFAAQSAIAVENARLFGEIARKSRELEIASQHKSQFVANMSHELRTPLAAMLGYAELLRDGMFGELPEKSVRIIERVQANGKHLLGLINTVLDISKIESGQFQLGLVEYSLDSMVETVRVATESLAAAKKLSFRTDVVKGMPYGLGDEPRLTQVLLNLVGNAIKFTDAGEVCISADAKNGSFVVSVSDTGPGIPDEERQRIFDKFHQVDSTSTKTKGGTGLGLAIAKEIVEMHGGRIWVESILGGGSTFRMELPVRAQASGAAA